MFQRRLMSAGQWSLQLRDDTPWSIRSQLGTGGLWGHVIITPSWVDPESVTETQMRAMARYVGVYRTRGDVGRSLSGAGLEIWMGDEDDKGDLTEVFVRGSGSFQLWIADWVLNKQIFNGLTTGSIESITGPFSMRVKPLATLRTLMDKLCDLANAEWRVNFDRTVDAGTVATLWPTTPTAVLSSLLRGRESGVMGLPVQSWSDQEDVEDQTSGVLVPYADNSNFTAYRPGLTAKRLDGNPVVMERYVSNDDDHANAANSTAMAQREQAKTGDVRVEISPTVDVWDIGAHVQPGHPVWAWEPELEMTGATMMEFGGIPTFPISKRVYATTQPHRPGFGTYIRPPVTSPTLLDISRWVVAEDGDCSVEIGAAGRSLLRVQRRGAA